MFKGLKFGGKKLCSGKALVSPPKKCTCRLQNFRHCSRSLMHFFCRILYEKKCKLVSLKGEETGGYRKLNGTHTPPSPPKKNPALSSPLPKIGNQAFDLQRARRPYSIVAVHVQVKEDWICRGREVKDFFCERPSVSHIVLFLLEEEEEKATIKSGRKGWKCKLELGMDYFSDSYPGVWLLTTLLQ